MFTKVDYKLEKLILKAIECQDNMRLAHLNDGCYAGYDRSLDMYLQECRTLAITMAQEIASYHDLCTLLSTLPGAEELINCQLESV